MTIQKCVLDEFKKEIDKSINHLKGNVRSLSQQSKSYQLSFISSVKSLDLTKKQIRDLRKFSKDINKTLAQQVEEIKQLPFVKEVRLTTRSISVDVGRIDIDYRGTTYYIGDFTIAITPQGVEIKNRSPVLVDDDYGRVWAEHPHIDSEDGNVCFGSERGSKIDEHFAKFQLKQLVYMVYLFLKTYTSNDYYVPIENWKEGVKRKERKPKAKEETKQEIG